MDLSGVALRAVFGYIVLLVLMRVSGKQTITQASAFEFTIVLILGDMVDKLLHGQVPAAQFVVGVTTLAVTHAAFRLARLRKRTEVPESMG